MRNNPVSTTPMFSSAMRQRALLSSVIPPVAIPHGAIQPAANFAYLTASVNSVVMWFSHVCDDLRASTMERFATTWHVISFLFLILMYLQMPHTSSFTVQIQHAASHCARTTNCPRTFAHSDMRMSCADSPCFVWVVWCGWESQPDTDKTVCVETTALYVHLSSVRGARSGRRHTHSHDNCTAHVCCTQQSTRV